MIGESLSPLLVDGAPDESGMLLYHEELIAFTGTAIGAIRGWYGLTLTTLGLTSWMAWVIHFEMLRPGHMTVFVLLIFAISVLIANQSVTPRHDRACASAVRSPRAGAPQSEILIATAGAVFAAGSVLALGSVAGG